MIRYYEIRPNREAWGTSLVIHAWVLALLLFVPAIKATEETLSEPLELTLLDLSAPGDRAAGENDAPAPRRVTAPIRSVPVTRPVERVTEPKPAAVREAPVPASPPREAIRAPIEEVRQPDLAALEAEEARRRAVEDQRRRELEEAGARQAYGGQGTSEDPPPAGGASGTGRGAVGDLAGRPVLDTPKPEYPRSAAARLPRGVVTVRALLRVDPGGDVEKAELLRSSGDPDIDSAALGAFRRWRFSPGRSYAEGAVSMRFKLQE